VLTLLLIVILAALKGKQRSELSKSVTDMEYRFGYVEFENAADAEKAYTAKRGTELDGRELNVDYSTPRGEKPAPRDRAQNRAKSFGDSVSPESDTLFVGNLSFDVDESIVGDAFGQYGSVRQVRLPTDP
jgi:nucleolin